MIRNNIGFSLYILGILVNVIAVTFLLINRLSSGEVKLHISSSRNKYLEIILFVVWTVMGISRFAAAEILVDYIGGFYWISLAIVDLFVINSGVEIREKGIFYFGELIRWKVIESFELKNYENTHRLKVIRRKPFLAFSKEINMTVPAEKLEDVIALLNQYLQR